MHTILNLSKSISCSVLFLSNIAEIFSESFLPSHYLYHFLDFQDKSGPSRQIPTLKKPYQSQVRPFKRFSFRRLPFRRLSSFQQIVFQKIVFKEKVFKEIVFQETLRSKRKLKFKNLTILQFKIHGSKGQGLEVYIYIFAPVSFELQWTTPEASNIHP